MASTAIRRKLGGGRSPAADLLAFQIEVLDHPSPAREFVFAPDSGGSPVRRWRFDFAYPDRWLAIEVDGAFLSGGRHGGTPSAARDLEKRLAAATRCRLRLRPSFGARRSRRAARGEPLRGRPCSPASRWLESLPSSLVLPFWRTPGPPGSRCWRSSAAAAGGSVAAEPSRQLDVEGVEIHIAASAGSGRRPSGPPATKGGPQSASKWARSSGPAWPTSRPGQGPWYSWPRRRLPGRSHERRLHDGPSPHGRVAPEQVGGGFHDQQRSTAARPCSTRLSSLPGAVREIYPAGALAASCAMLLELTTPQEDPSPRTSTAAEEAAHGVHAPTEDVLAKRPNWQV